MDGQTLTLVRGLPGSGTNDFGLFLVHGKDSVVLLSDSHYLPKGISPSNFGLKKVKEAHQKCLEVAAAYLERGYSVIVSNPFIHDWEFSPYLDLAKDMGIKTYSIVVENRHNGTSLVPEVQMRKMSSQFNLCLN